MEDKGLGNIIFYIILAIIGLAGSFKGKKKTPGQGAPKKTFSWPDFSGEVTHSFPDVFDEAKTPEPVSQPVPVKKTAPKTVTLSSPVSKAPAYNSSGRYSDGEYEEPMAGHFAGEGNYSDTLADRFSNEGSMADDFASRFRNEGSLHDTMAESFANEGISAIGETQIRMPSDNTISDSEITSEEAYDYNDIGKYDDKGSSFNVRKAVIYSILLERKEYSY